mmetsp:Transcript_159549/g.306263  ORF Transcript_159549/g.306263 Transcript_159549/m.306263 type:complete len:230 (-) Transcript_159549:55-744(-)
MSVASTAPTLKSQGSMSPMTATERMLMHNYVELREEVTRMRQEFRGQIADIRREAMAPKQPTTLSLDDRSKLDSIRASPSTALQTSTFDNEKWKQREADMMADLASVRRLVIDMQVMMRHYVIKTNQLALRSAELNGEERRQRLIMLDDLEARVRNEVVSIGQRWEEKDLFGPAPAVTPFGGSGSYPGVQQGQGLRPSPVAGDMGVSPSGDLGGSARQVANNSNNIFVS